MALNIRQVVAFEWPLFVPLGSFKVNEVVHLSTDVIPSSTLTIRYSLFS